MIWRAIPARALMTFCTGWYGTLRPRPPAFPRAYRLQAPTCRTAAIKRTALPHRLVAADRQGREDRAARPRSLPIWVIVRHALPRMFLLRITIPSSSLLWIPGWTFRRPL